MNEQLDRIEVKLAELQGKLDEVGESARKARLYLQVALWVTVGAILVPLLILPMLIPAFLGALGGGALGF